MVTVYKERYAPLSPRRPAPPVRPCGGWRWRGPAVLYPVPTPPTNSPPQNISQKSFTFFVTIPPSARIT